MTTQLNQKMSLAQIPYPLLWLQPFDFPHKLGICERLFGQAIASKGISWVRTGAGIPWKLDLTNPTHRWIVYGKYEGSGFLTWAKQFLPPNGVIVDSGANIGQMLQYFAQWVPDGQVLAFEPGKEASDWLKECLTAHPTLPVELLTYGLGATSAQLRLQTIGTNFGHGAWNQISETEGEAIQIVRLTDEVEKRALKKIDLWKLDVEGYEIPALQGAEELLREKRIRAVYVELIGDNGQRIRDHLDLLGYRCFWISDKGQLYPFDKLTGHANGLFLPE